jgi:hypothetical protein
MANQLIPLPTLVCINCGGQFLPKRRYKKNGASNGFRLSKCCGYKCSNISGGRQRRKDVPILTCFNCGKHFNAKQIFNNQGQRDGYNKNKFCSRKCLNATVNEQRKLATTIIKICINCKSQFLAQRYKTNKCCSRECFIAYQSRLHLKYSRLKTCLNCGASFERNPRYAIRSGKYCSQECTSTVKAKNMAEKYEDPLFRMKGLEGRLKPKAIEKRRNNRNQKILLIETAKHITKTLGLLPEDIMPNVSIPTKAALWFWSHPPVRWWGKAISIGQYRRHLLAKTAETLIQQHGIKL